MSPDQSASLPVSPRRVANPEFVPREAATRGSFTSRIFSLFSTSEQRASERRRNKRVPAPPLRAYLGVFGSTQSYPVGNISSTGFYLQTKEHWMPGTNMPLRLERTDRPGFEALHCVAVPARVVRTDHYGIGFSFVFKDVRESARKSTAQPTVGWQGARWADRQAIEELVTELDSTH